MKHKIMLTAAAAIISGLGAIASGCMPSVGHLPDGADLERISKSPHWNGERFVSLEPTEIHMGTVKSAYSASMFDFFLGKPEWRYPKQPLPLMKTDLRTIPGGDCVVWLGHSSIFIRLGGHTVLIDPVFEKNAGPFWTNKAFEGDYPFNADELPFIDCLIISHDHWDHLEYPTTKKLKDKVGKAVVPLGVGSHLVYWGWDRAKIFEGDWGDQYAAESGLKIRLLPARHASGRWLTKDRTFWASFLIEGDGRRIFYTGDNAYGRHYAEIGRHYGGMDLALMECGQYDLQWHNIHMLPEESIRAADEIGTKAVIPVHSGRFSIALHPWAEPYQKYAEAAPQHVWKLLTPKIGEPVYLDEIGKKDFPHWWEGLK